MRVIAGTLSGRNFASPRTHRTHPMSDKVRGALFNALGELDGLTVLDAFAGSGAEGIEAVSRGADSVVAVDIDPEAAKTITANVQALGIAGKLTIRRMGLATWSQTNPAAMFDVVLADPPYDDVQLNTVQRLTAHVRPEGLLVLSWPGKDAAPDFTGFAVVSHKAYGDAQLVFYRRTA